MKKLRFAFFGAGFWAPCQLAAWRELKGVECAAIYNRTRAKAEKLAAQFGIPSVYNDPREMLRRERLDFVDIATGNDTHEEFVLLAVKNRLPVICQKPMAPTLAACERMVAACRHARVPFFIHENYRWQTPIRALRAELARGTIGTPFRARFDSISGFPDITMQPFLAKLEQYIIADMGVHIIDMARFVFGEATSVYCRTQRIHRHIKGEDVATIVLGMKRGATVSCHLALAENFVEKECFPETLVFIEGDKGTLELAPGHWLRVTTKDGTRARRFPPPRYPWADPAYDLSQAAIVPCHENLLQALRRRRRAETSADDNLKTLRLAFAAYESARTAQAIHLT